MQPAERVVARRAEHDHAAAKHELRMGDAAFAVIDDEMLLEAEGIAQPPDHLGRIAVAYRGDNRAAHFLLLVLGLCAATVSHFSMNVPIGASWGMFHPK